MNIAIVGAGNVATHLAKALKNASVAITTIWSFHFENAQALANEVNAQAVRNLHKLVDGDNDLIIVAVKDDAISEVAAQLEDFTGIVAHTSGAVDLSVLEQFENHGVFYPLQTFSKHKAVDFNAVPLCLEANNEATLNTLKEIANLLSEKSYEVDSKQREALHVAAVFACNFPNYLYRIAEELLAKQQLSFEMIRPLINETASKVQTALPAAVQTGPAVRGDQHTLTKHMDLLKQNPSWRAIYSLLSDNIMRSK